MDSLGKLIGVINTCTFDKINATGFLRIKEYWKVKNVDKTELENLTKEHIIFTNDDIKKWSLIITL